MLDPLPCLILTRASGIVGRGFLQAAQNRFGVYALARRSQQNARTSQYPDYLAMRYRELRGHSSAVYDLLSAAGARQELSHPDEDLEKIVENLNAFYTPTNDGLTGQMSNGD